MSSQNNQVLFNEKQLLESVFGDAVFLRKLLDIFLNDSQSLLIEIAEALDMSDGNTLRRKAHSMKNLGRNISSQLLIDIALELEKNGEREVFSEAKEKYPKLRELVFELQRAVRLFIDESIPN
ncbi:MAG: Hpt domain-containing protein [Deltaproteobacteria bacterium]|nr:Hpt domain-containing protein [Deltaproteobacteria bacterium]